MKIFNAIASATAACASLFANSPAHARPFIYTNALTYNGASAQCVKGAEALLAKYKFTDFEREEDKEYRFAGIAGHQEDDVITAQIDCYQKLGITTLTVSGLDNLQTFEFYKKLLEEKW